MVYQKRYRLKRGRRIGRRIVRAHHQGKSSSLATARRFLKRKKRVTWDKAISLREEEIQEVQEENTRGSSPLNPPSLNHHAQDRRAGVSGGGEHHDHEQGHPNVGQQALQLALRNKGKRIVNEYQCKGPSRGRELQIRRQKAAKNSMKSRSPSPKKTTNDSSALIQTSSLREFVNVKLDYMKPWVDPWLVEGDEFESYRHRVARLLEKRYDMDGNEYLVALGNVVRLNFDSRDLRLMLTAGHILRRGRDLGPLQAFGAGLRIRLLSKKYDLAILHSEMPCENGFRLAGNHAEEQGRQVQLLAYPWYVDTVWNSRLNEIKPCVMKGLVANMGPDNLKTPAIIDRLATYHGGLHGCSGGAVTLNSKELCGVHTGVSPYLMGDQVLPPNIENFLNPTQSQIYSSISPSSCTTDNNCTRRKKRMRSMNSKTTDPSFFEKLTTPQEQEFAPFMDGIGTGVHGHLAVYVSAPHIREECQAFYTDRIVKKIMRKYGEYPYEMD